MTDLKTLADRVESATAEEIASLKQELQRLRVSLYSARQTAKSRGRGLLREEADAVLCHFTPAWEMLRDVAARTGRYSAQSLASRARDLQSRGLVESKWVGAERTSSFKVWRLKGRPVPIHASGPAPLRAHQTIKGSGE